MQKTCLQPFRNLGVLLRPVLGQQHNFFCISECRGYVNYLFFSLPAHKTTKQSLGSVPVHQSRNRGHPVETGSVELYIPQTPTVHFRSGWTLIGRGTSLMPSLAYKMGAAFTFPSSETGWQLWPAPLLQNPSSSLIYRFPYKPEGLEAGESYKG